MGYVECVGEDLKKIYRVLTTPYYISQTDIVWNINQYDDDEDLSVSSQGVNK